jgi:ABC-type multidrug transport system permease subunit
MNIVGRLFARDALELSRSRGLLVLLFAVPVLLLLLVGHLKVREPQLRAALVQAGAEDEPRLRLHSALQELAGVEVVDWPAERGDDRAQRAVRERVDLVIAWSGDEWRFYSPVTNGYRLASVQAAAQALALSMRRDLQRVEQAGRLDRLGEVLRRASAASEPAAADAQAILAELQGQANDDAALPTPLLRAWLANRLQPFYPVAAPSEHALVPGFIALIAVFLPFLLASSALVREREAGTFEMLIICTRSNGALLAAGKLLMPVAVSLLATLLLLVAARSVFSFGIKPGLMAALGLQAVAATGSGLLGLALSMLLRSARDAYTASAVYLVACILITGLIYPVEQAAWGVAAVSYVFPLTLSGAPLEEWMLKGAGARIEPWRLGALAAQLLAAIALCAIALRRLRRSL